MKTMDVVLWALALFVLRTSLAIDTCIAKETSDSCSSIDIFRNNPLYSEHQTVRNTPSSTKQDRKSNIPVQKIPLTSSSKSEVVKQKTSVSGTTTEKNQVKSIEKSSSSSKVTTKRGKQNEAQVPVIKEVKIVDDVSPPSKSTAAQETLEKIESIQHTSRIGSDMEKNHNVPLVDDQTQQTNLDKTVPVKQFVEVNIENRPYRFYLLPYWKQVQFQLNQWFSLCSELFHNGYHQLQALWLYLVPIVIHFTQQVRHHLYTIYSILSSYLTTIYHIALEIWNQYEVIQMITRHFLALGLIMSGGGVFLLIYRLVSFIPDFVLAVFTTLSPQTQLQVHLLCLLTGSIVAYQLKATWSFWITSILLLLYYYWSGHVITKYI